MKSLVLINTGYLNRADWEGWIDEYEEFSGLYLHHCGIEFIDRFGALAKDQKSSKKNCSLEKSMMILLASSASFKFPHENKDSSRVRDRAASNETYNRRPMSTFFINPLEKKDKKSKTDVNPDIQAERIVKGCDKLVPIEYADKSWCTLITLPQEAFRHIAYWLSNLPRHSDSEGHETCLDIAKRPTFGLIAQTRLYLRPEKKFLSTVGLINAHRFDEASMLQADYTSASKRDITMMLKSAGVRV